MRWDALCTVGQSPDQIPQQSGLAQSRWGPEEGCCKKLPSRNSWGSTSAESPGCSRAIRMVTEEISRRLVLTPSRSTAVPHTPMRKPPRAVRYPPAQGIRRRIPGVVRHPVAQLLQLRLSHHRVGAAPVPPAPPLPAAAASTSARPAAAVPPPPPAAPPAPDGTAAAIAAAAEPPPADTAGWRMPRPHAPRPFLCDAPLYARPDPSMPPVLFVHSVNLYTSF